MALDFTPSLKKVEWAESKLGNIKSVLTSYANSDPHSIRTELHDNMFHVIARREKPVPEEIARETVEIVGHLRSALDKMIVAVVAHNGKGVSGVHFPFGGMSNGQPDPFPSKRTYDSLEKKLTPDQLALVLAQKPYPGGNDLLWAINEVANEDKHRQDLVSVVPSLVFNSVSFTNAVISGGKHGIVLGCEEFESVVRDKERETLLFSYGNGPRQPQIDCHISLAVSFSNVAPVRGKELSGVLCSQLRLVKGIIETFAKAFT